MKKRKDGYYRASKVIDGKQKWFYGRSKNEAIKKMEEYSQKSASPLFKDIAAEWWDVHSEELAYNSVKPLYPAYKRAVDEFGDMNITDITPSDVSRFIRDFAKLGYADKTTRTQLGAVNMIFKYAINYVGIDMVNPARDVQVPRGLSKKKVTLPSDEDIQKVKESVDLDFGLFPFMLMYTGLRKGELLALRWEDIKDGFITIDKSVYYESTIPKVKLPKTERSVRRVPVLDKLSPFITGKKGIIFNEKGKYMPPQSFLRKWRNYCNSTGIKCTPHQLRHCFATMLYEGGISHKDAQYLLGHSQLSTTMDIYTDIRHQREKEMAENIKSMDIRV